MTNYIDLAISESNQSPIKVKKHGRMAKSIFKYGLDYIASVLLNPVNQNNIKITKFLSCT